METKDIFERMASRYDNEERVANAEIIAAAIRARLSDACDKRALDYGCGTGLVGLALADLFGSILLVDTSPQMIEQVQRKIVVAGITNADTLVADFCAEAPDGLRVDCVILSQVLLHVKDYPLLLNRLCAMLNDGGRLIIVDFDRNERVVSNMVHPGFNQRELAHLLEQIGFTFVHSSTFHHGQRMFMNEDASLFILDAEKPAR